MKTSGEVLKDLHQTHGYIRHARGVNKKEEAILYDPAVGSPCTGESINMDTFSILLYKGWITLKAVHDAPPEVRYYVISDAGIAHLKANGTAQTVSN